MYLIIQHKTYDFAYFDNSLKQAGKDLWALLLERNTRIILKKPEGKNIKRINSFNHDALKKILRQSNVLYEETPAR